MQVANTPLEEMLREIERALVGGFPRLAITMAVALPDVCQSLWSADGRSDRQLYKNWCRDFLLGPKFTYVSADDLYSLRCGVVHNGRFGDLEHSVSRIVFVLSENVTMVNCIANDVYIYSASEFCRNIVTAVRRWYEQHRHSPTVQSNMTRMMRLHPTGLPGVIVGPPCLG